MILAAVRWEAGCRVNRDVMLGFGVIAAESCSFQAHLLSLVRWLQPDPRTPANLTMPGLRLGSCHGSQSKIGDIDLFDLGSVAYRCFCTVTSDELRCTDVL